jgi:hypothetical protein
MVRDKTFHNCLANVTEIAFKAGADKAEKGVLKLVNERIFSKMKYFCVKHMECGDVLSFCLRKTDIPCCYRVLNDSIVEVDKLMKDNGI